MKRANEEWVVTKAGLVVPRRAVLRGGLAGLAAAFVSRALPGCGTPDAADAGTDAARARDAGSRDAGPRDAGPMEFPMRDVPDPPALVSRLADVGPLGDPDANGLRLPPGFTSRIIGRQGQAVEGTDYAWHYYPDGGATYATEDGGWIYASNSEIPLIGGVGAVRFDASGNIVGAYRILDGTNVNCAGGKTPWHTWMSCEEVARGRVHECDPWGEHPPIPRPALGVFKHEACAVDTINWHLFLTEDEPDGCFYRFVPDRLNERGFPDLRSGRLEVASVANGGAVTWVPVPDPLYEGGTPTRRQVEEATHFDGGEGIWFHDGTVYFSTKGDNRVWAYEVATSQLTILYDGDAMSEPPIRGVDNLTVSCCGDVLVAEDGGAMRVMAILANGEIKPLVQVVGHDGSEITGPAFDPSGTRLYFSSQRGGAGGITYEVTGPFHEPA